ncbi:MAG: RNA polymerase sporulation sigma factor SigH [Lachnospiraceae bacterium]|nr:RNA polymerase sporulation sigma factor SigH [Lachnospiraceae bacterium]
MIEHNYSHYTDEEIIRFCRSGEDTATDYLLEKYKSLVRKKARTLYLIGGETEDLIQEGMIALYKAIREFDPEHENSFIHFANLCIERQLYNVIKGANRLKNSPLNSYISLYSPMETDEDFASRETLADTLQPIELINPEDILIDKENVTDIQSAITSKLSELEQAVVDLYIDGCNYQQIATRLGKSAKSIDNALQRIKKKLAPLG